MKINGKEVTSGTVVIGPGEQATIDSRIGPLPVAFRRDDGPPRTEIADGNLVFLNTDNVLGTTANFDIQVGGGGLLHLACAVYTVGEGDNATRVLHFTIDA